VGVPGNSRRITNVAAGVAPTDVATVGQLVSLRAQVEEVRRECGVPARTGQANGEWAYATGLMCLPLVRSYGLATKHTQVDPFRDFVKVIVSGDCSTAIKLLDASPMLAKERAVRGATRQASKQHFFDQILHYIYEGDTALHMAAAAYQSRIVAKLIAKGADVRARNRRGAEPLHYAVDGGPGLPAWNPSAQMKIIARLIRAGADPNALDKNGVAPLHRAVRNRCAAAVRALLEGGADPRATNTSGSTPMLLASQNTGRGGSGSSEAKAQQRKILRFLKDHGAA
jgi:Ankyrin repeats (many copies)/Coiled stalk of trimeric autotransporter adhesin